MRKGFGRTAALALAAGIIAAVPVVASFAQSATDTIKVRRAAMKELGAHSKAIAGFLKGSQDAKKAAALGTIGDMELRAEAVASIAGRIPTLFPKGTGLDSQPPKSTGAKPAIWSDWSGFQSAAGKLKTLAEATQKAAQSGDKKAFAAAFARMGKEGCGGCHSKFREKL